MTFTKTTCGSTLIASLMMLVILALSMGQTIGFDDSLFEGRSQFLCFGSNSDIVKLNDGEPNGPNFLALNARRRYSFTVPNLKRARCTTTRNSGDGDVDLFLCRDPDADACIANPTHGTPSPSSEETVTTSLGGTWHVFVKGNVAPVTFTVQCDEVFA